MKCLGLDISTTSTGWSVLTDQFVLVDYGRIDFPSDKPQKERLVIFGELLTAILTKYNPDYVIIEDTFVKFDPMVTKKLSRFAGVAIMNTAIFNLNIITALISPQSIKSAIFPKQKVDKEDIKIEMLKKFNLITFDTSLPKETILKIPAVKKYCNDVTDAIAISHFPYLKQVEAKWMV